MRLWSLHPMYLDRQGLTAVWREGLLAQAVLRGRTRGYRSHPQLDRFREASSPFGTIAAYLRAVCEEASARGYEFDGGRIVGRPSAVKLSVPRGQLLWEWQHLRAKLSARSPAIFERWQDLDTPRTHPLFRTVAGGIAAWERGAGG